VRAWFIFAFALSLVGLTGCTNKQVSVSGQVLLGDKPLQQGAVSYHPDTSKGNVSKNMAVGTIDSDGQYTLSSNGKSGAPAGWYKVTVNATVPSNPKDPYSRPVSLIDKKYTAAETTPLQVEVKDNAPAGAYDLKVSK